MNCKHEAADEMFLDAVIEQLTAKKKLRKLLAGLLLEQARLAEELRRRHEHDDTDTEKKVGTLDLLAPTHR